MDKDLDKEIIEKSRYPGVSPFSEKQEEIFFGRESDAQKLIQLIDVRKQVLLYAKSGVGKTSLLMAGVVPKLKKKYVPLKIRFNAYTKETKKSPVQTIASSLLDYTGKTETLLDKLSSNILVNKTLWYYFKKQQLLDHEKILLLIFDQFEELFSYPDEEINEFKQQLYELMQTGLPDELIDLFVENPGLAKEEDINVLYGEPQIKIVYAIRSDKLNLLNRLADKITDIQLDYYELKPLERKQAYKAMEAPAVKEGDYTVPQFTFMPEALDIIWEKLTSNGEQKLETTQLQIVCQKIEQNIFEKQDFEVKVQELPEFKDIFHEFYNDSVKKVSSTYQDAARELIETKLILNYRRISYDGGNCSKFLPEDELQKLVKAHLLGAEPNNLGGYNYELSHDTLIDPISDAAKKRKEIEKIFEQKKTTKNKLRKIGLFFLIVFLTVSVVFILSLYSQKKIIIEQNKQLLVQSESINKQNKQLKLKNDSLIKYREIQKSLLIDTVEFKRFVDDGDQLIESNKYEEAIENYDSALVRINDIKIVIKKEKAQNKIHEKEAIKNSEFEKLTKQGDELQARGFKYYIEALLKYEAAFELKKSDTYLLKKIEELKLDIENQYDIFIRDCKIFIKAEGYKDAEKMTKNALILKPNDELARELLKECENK